MLIWNESAVKRQSNPPRGDVARQAAARRACRTLDPAGVGRVRMSFMVSCRCSWKRLATEPFLAPGLSWNRRRHLA